MAREQIENRNDQNDTTECQVKDWSKDEFPSLGQL